MDFTERLGRILRGFSGGGGDRPRPRLEDADPDDVLRDAGVPPGRRSGARPAAAAGGLPPAVARAYANLELTPPASLDEAKTAWRKLMAKYHPDRHQGDQRKIDVATKVAAQLTDAYRIVREHLGG